MLGNYTRRMSVAAPLAPGADELRPEPHRGRQDREPARHRVDPGLAEPLRERGHDARVHAGDGRGQVGTGDLSDESDRLGKAELPGQALELPTLRAVTHQREREGHRVGRGGRPQRPQQVHQPLLG